MKYKGYQINESKGHGKTVRGGKRTSTIRVEDHGKSKYVTPGKDFLLIKQFRFTVGSKISRDRAIQKAKEYIDKELIN